MEFIPANRRCPYCAEPIQAAALVCRYCQRDLRPRSPLLRRLLQAFGILSLVWALIVIWPTVGRGILWLTNTPVGIAATVPEPPPPVLQGASIRATDTQITIRNSSPHQWTELDVDLSAAGGPYYYRLPRILHPGQAFSVLTSRFKTAHGQEFHPGRLSVWHVRVSATLPTSVRHVTTTDAN